MAAVAGGNAKLPERRLTRLKERREGGREGGGWRRTEVEERQRVEGMEEGGRGWGGEEEQIFSLPLSNYMKP